MPINFSTPERCLLAQAAHWFIDGTMPLSDDIYRRASEPEAMARFPADKAPNAVRIGLESGPTALILPHLNWSILLYWKQEVSRYPPLDQMRGRNPRQTQHYANR